MGEFVVLVILMGMWLFGVSFFGIRCLGMSFL